ncbi:MAG: DUF2290 domain-containing protein [Bradyrhizobium sp.]
MKIQSLQILVEKLVEKGLLFETREIRASKSGREQIIEVGETGPLSIVKTIPENSVIYYLELIKESKFSWMLFDASLVQIWYRIRRGEIVGHRFCYIPAPFEVDLREGNGASDLAEIIEGGSAASPLEQSRRTILRFECDPQAQAESHPAAHLHLNSNNCRIPMRSAITVKEFVNFLLRFFYSSQFESTLVETNFAGPSLLSDEEQRSFHLNWRVN